MAWLDFVALEKILASKVDGSPYECGFKLWCKFNPDD